jgi:hemerythrin-like domain-containing protein
MEFLRKRERRKETIMNPTAQLRAEHEGIKVMLRIISSVCDKIDAEQKLNREHFSRILEFLAIFIDKCHHGKEEDLLFPAMEASGISPQDKAITFTLAEHRTLRSYVKDMRDAFGDFEKDERKASAGIVESGRKYVKLLTSHIEKENKVLFPMADKVLSKAKQDELSEAFERLEVERIGPGKHEEFHELLNRLGKIYPN